MRTLNLGLIGCGHIANKHVHTIQNHQEYFQLTDICDTDPIQVEQLISTYNLQGINKHHDYKQILQNEAIDLVIVTAPSGLHYQIARDALTHKKHVIVEKPVVLRREELNDLVRLTTNEPYHLFVCHQLRYRPIFQELKKQIVNHAFGELHSGIGIMQVNRSLAYFREKQWRGTWQMDGGMLFNQGMHFIDLLCWFMEEVEFAQGTIVNTQQSKETEDIAAAILTFKNGAIANIYGDIITKPTNLGYLLSITGENGMFAIRGPNFNQVDRVVINGEDLTEAFSELATDTKEHNYMYQDIYNHIVSTNKPAIISPSEIKKSINGIFSIYESCSS